MSVYCVYKCLCVPLKKTRFPVDWRLLVSERVANIGIPLDIFHNCAMMMIFGFFFFKDIATVHNGTISRGRVCGCGCWPQ